MAEQRRELSPDAHQHGIGTAYDSAFPRQRDAARQHLDVILFEALGSAMLAFGSALITYLDTVCQHSTLENFIVHIVFV